VLGTRVKDFFEQAVGLPSIPSYALAIITGTGVLLFFGEITPKVFAIRAQETYARMAVVPMFTIVKLLTPLCNGLLSFTDMLFRITRLRELRAMPYITDDELKSFLAAGADQGGAEEEGRLMIRRILEFNDVTVKEILTPRPDIVALHESATVAEALVVYRDHGYSRIPLYSDSLDHITGVVYAKELLPSLSKGNLIRPVKELARAPHFVPETMKVQAFVRHVQRNHAHLGVVVDEYGGTEGLVSLQDAIEQIVGDIGEEGEEDSPGYERIAPSVYRVEGNLDLDKLSELVGVSIDDEEHQTVAGFLMNKAGKVPEQGDRIEFSGVTFTVEGVTGKRVEYVRIEAPHSEEEGLDA
jgi:CBS domain containing-hemolysin-like protein